MLLATYCCLRGQKLRALCGLAILLLLTGCAAQSTLGRPRWYGQTRPVTGLGIPETARAGQQAVDVDFEVPTPQRAEGLRQGGVHLPRVSAEMAEPHAHRDFVDLRVTAVGFGITAGGYLLYCDGLPLPVLVPESHVDLGLTDAVPLNASIYPDRDTALADIANSPHEPRHAKYAWYRGAGGALIVPTLFSPATTPRIAQTMREVRKHQAETLQRELKVLSLTLTGTRVLQGVFSRVVRLGSEPALRPLARSERLEGETPAPRQPVTRAAAPAPGSSAPSPGLVRALTGNNTTPPSAAVPRLPQDAAVNPKVPRLRQLNRPIGPSPSQNAQLQTDIEYLDSMGATNIRVNQQQITVRNTQRVGINRPDLQFDYNGRRYHVEYDTPTSERGLRHQSRITSNDSNAEIILLIVP